MFLFLAVALLPLLLPFLLQVQARQPTLLVYSATAGYRHDSIPTAINALQTISTNLNIITTFSEDKNLFTSTSLAQFDMIAFLSNSDQVLTTSGEVALEQWLTKGGSLLGFHAATACLFNDTSFGVMLGSWFDYHPTISNASFTKLISHPTIDMLPSPYNSYEEVYSFRTDPRSVNATILLSVDETSYTDTLRGTTGYYQGSPHPIAWFRDGSITPVDLSNGTKDGDGINSRGRMWYTSLGHTNETWQSTLHLQHISAGIQWVIQGLSISNSTSTSSTFISSSNVATSKATSLSALSAAATITSSGSSTTSTKPISTSSTSTSSSSTNSVNSMTLISMSVLVLFIGL